MADEKFLRYGDIAELFGVTVRTAKNYAKAGKLRKHKIGNSVLFFESEVLEDIRKAWTCSTQGVSTR